MPTYSTEPHFAGLRADEAMARLIWNAHPAALCCDNPAVEVVPGDPKVGSLHRRLLPTLGTALGEMFALDELGRRLPGRRPLHVLLRRRAAQPAQRHRVAGQRRRHPMTAAGELDLTRFIRPGDTVLVGQSTGEPRALVEALIAQRHELAPLTVFIGSSYTGLLRPEHADALRFVGFGAVGRTGALVQAGVVELHPVHFGAIPGLITSGRIPIDVVLAQVSPPGPDGSHSLGLVADYVAPAIGVARTTLAELNRHVPYTFGDTVVAADRLAVVIEDDRPLIEVERRAPLPEDEVIAALIADLIPDGATIQFGIGGTPDAVLAGLHDRRRLGVHSGILSDAFVDLVEAGVVTNERKEIDTGVSVTGALLGTTRLYDWARENRALSMRAATLHPRRVGARRARDLARHELGRRGRPHRPDQRRVGGRPLRRAGRWAGRVRSGRADVAARPLDRRPALDGT